MRQTNRELFVETHALRAITLAFVRMAWNTQNLLVLSVVHERLLLCVAPTVGGLRETIDCQRLLMVGMEADAVNRVVATSTYHASPQEKKLSHLPAPLWSGEWI